MDIPIIPIRIKGREAVSSDIMFSGPSVTMSEDTERYADITRSLTDVCGKDVPALVVDVKGMQRKDIIPEILKRIKMRREVWLMTGIHDTVDMMDAFQGDADKVAVPYHFTSDALLREMTELSDCCMPVLFVDRDGVHVRGKRKELRAVIRTLENMNFGRILAFDISGGDPVRIWEGAAGISDALVPYVSSGTAYDIDSVHRLGFPDVMVSGVRLLQNTRR